MPTPPRARGSHHRTLQPTYRPNPLIAIQRKKQLTPSVAALAPDVGTATRAAGLATTRRWKNLEGNPEVIWGECKSSGTSYYRVVVELSEATPRPSCNCPVRSKFCKHNLALIELFREQSDAFRITEEAPEWVLTYLEKLHTGTAAAPSIRTEEREAELAAARLSNRQKRLAEMSAGLVQLEDWLADLVRTGVAQLSGQDVAYWEELSARMTDAKLGGIGNRVRGLANLRTAADPHAAMLAELADIYLLLRGFRQLDRLPPPLQQELLNLAGINFKKEDVLELDGIDDTWFCCGQNEGSRDETLFWRRTWLYGERHRRFALLLDFAHGRTPYPDVPRPGQMVRGAVSYFPSSFPQRALLKPPTQLVDEAFHLAPDATIAALVERYATALRDNPWNNLLPVWLDGATPVLERGECLLVDTDGHIVRCTSDDYAAQRLFALALGKRTRVFGEWNGQRLTLLTALAPDDDRLVLLRDHQPLSRPAGGFW